MITALEQFPISEYQSRIQKCRDAMNQNFPQVGGMLVCSRLNIYYLTGTLGVGLLWIPNDNREPILLLRKGLERAKVESPIKQIYQFKSYKEIRTICEEAGSPLSSTIAIEKKAFTWTMAEMFQQRVPGINCLSCDGILEKLRSIKSEWERKKIRICGERHKRILEDILPQELSSGHSELEIAHLIWKHCFEHGHQGMLRCNNPGEELFLGYVSVGESGNYPSYFNGALTGRGIHPAVPFMGDAGVIWKKHMLLAVDIGFMLEGYQTDKTQIFWSGPVSSIPDKIKRAQDRCKSIYEKVFSMLQPGVTPEEVWNVAKKESQSIESPATFMGTGKDAVPFLGHGIGLTIDEYPVFAAGFKEPLQEGMVIAIEPKISLPGLGTVGLEHTLEITATGVRSLTGTNLDIIPVE